jgi:hypothetical protein
VVPQRAVLLAGAVLAAVAVVALGYPPLGHALFGTMDQEWLGIVRKLASYNFPGLWSAGDLINVSMSIVVSALAGVTMLRGRPRPARFLLIGAVLGAVGIATMFIAGWFRTACFCKASRTACCGCCRYWNPGRVLARGALGGERDRASRVAAVLLVGFLGSPVLSASSGPVLLCLLFLPAVLSSPRARRDKVVTGWCRAS